MIRTILIIGSLIFSFYYAGAQVDISSTESNWIDYSQIQVLTKRVSDEERFQGDLYYHDNWRNAVFELSSKDSVRVDSVKFNLLRGRAEMMIKGEHLEIDNRDYESFFFLDELEAVFKYKHYYYYEGNRLPGVIKVMEAGDYSVIIAYDPELREISKENPFMLGEMQKDRVRITKMRFIEQDGELTRIKSKKDLDKYFKSKSSMRKYISKNKLSHKSEYDIAQALMVYQESE